MSWNGSAFALVDRQNLAFRPRIERRCRPAGISGMSAAQWSRSRSPATLRNAARVCSAKRSREPSSGYRACGKVTKPIQRLSALKAEILLAQPHKAGDEQRRAREQRDRQRNLRADQEFAEPQLAHTAARAAAAFLKRRRDRRAKFATPDKFPSPSRSRSKAQS